MDLILKNRTPNFIELHYFEDGSRFVVNTNAIQMMNETDGKCKIWLFDSLEEIGIEVQESYDDVFNQIERYVQ